MTYRTDIRRPAHFDLERSFGFHKVRSFEDPLLPTEYQKASAAATSAPSAPSVRQPHVVDIALLKANLAVSSIGIGSVFPISVRRSPASVTSSDLLVEAVNTFIDSEVPSSAGDVLDSIVEANVVVTVAAGTFGDAGAVAALQFAADLVEK